MLRIRAVDLERGQKLNDVVFCFRILRSGNVVCAALGKDQRTYFEVELYLRGLAVFFEFLQREEAVLALPGLD